MGTKITYYAVFGWMYIHALLPLKILYLLSDILYIFVYCILRYRRKLVRENLTSSFPNKTSLEILLTEKKFYRHFCDYFVETIKLLHISDKEIQDRIVFKNTELINKLTKDGNSCLLYLGHYGNWEWIPSITLQFDKNITLGQIYRPLKNQAIDSIFLKIRSRFGSISIAKNDTLRSILKLKADRKKMLIGFISDQTPSWYNVNYWTKFMNQDTPIFTGVEKIGKKTGFAITYLDVIKTGRGKYVCEIKLISDNPKSEAEFAITEKYVQELEKTILREPAYWLWTHNRWKHKRENSTK